jgi:hypothetical protein
MPGLEAADILPTRTVGSAAHRETPLAMNAVVCTGSPGGPSLDDTSFRDSRHEAVEQRGQLSTGLVAPGARSASSTPPRSSSPAAT